MSPHLKVIARAGSTETIGQLVRRHQAEAKRLALDHVASLAAQMVAVEEIAEEIAQGGDAYPVGVRDLCRRLVEDLDSRVSTLEAIAGRVA